MAYNDTITSCIWPYMKYKQLINREQNEILTNVEKAEIGGMYKSTIIPCLSLTHCVLNHLTFYKHRLSVVKQGLLCLLLFDNYLNMLIFLEEKRKETHKSSN